MKGYVLPLTCPLCGGELEHVNGTDAMDVGTEVKAIAHCEPCRDDFVVSVLLRSVRRNSSVGIPRFGSTRGPAECGTDTGYHRHRRNGERPCQPCKEAHAAYERRRSA